jgi:glycosyltransferase involved in cell wall biosynthesis
MGSSEFSDTCKVREAIRHGETGQLVDFFDTAALAQQVAALCENPTERARLGAQARAFAVEHYDLETRCLPRQIEWVQGLAGD